MNDVFKKHGAVSWTELMTTDVEAAKAFYGDLFGWRIEEMPMGDQGPYNVIYAGDEHIGGMMHTPPEAEGAPPHWGSYVTVDDVDTVAKRVGELGGKVLFGPHDIPEVGRFCVLRDPQGAVISAITYVEFEDCHD